MEYEIIKIKDTTYSSFLAQLESQNNMRSQKADKKGIVYGASRFTKDTFYKYLTSVIEIELISKLTDNGVIICSEKNLKEYFDSIKDEQYKLPPTAEYTLFSIDVSTDKAEQTMNEVLKIIESKSKQNKVKKVFPSISISTVLLNEDTERSLQKENGILYSAMMDLRQGEISPVFKNNNFYGILKCISYKKGGYKSFLENKDSVAMQYRQTKFNEYIDELCKECKPKWNKYFNHVMID